MDEAIISSFCCPRCDLTVCKPWLLRCGHRLCEECVECLWHEQKNCPALGCEMRITGSAPDLTGCPDSIIRAALDGWLSLDEAESATLVVREAL